MSLVAYESSDGSGDDEPSPSVQLEEVVKRTPLAFGGSALDKLRSIASTSRGTIQIVAPSLAEIEDSSSEEDEPRLKVKTPSEIGSGLKSLLPPAKSSVLQKATSLIPDSVKRSKPAPTLPPPKKIHATSVPKEIIEEDDNFDGQFFSIEEPARYQNEQTLNPRIQIAPEIPSTVPVVHSYVSNEECAPSVSQPEMSELQYKKIIASKFGESSADDIRIMDVNVNDHLSQNREYIKTVSLETDEPEKAGEAPNPTVRRKNHILSLAHQAKQRELALKNEWAQNKINKNQTRAKYGF